MTADEYRTALEQLTDEKFASFRESWGGAKATREECVKEFVYSTTPLQFEQTIVYWLKTLGVSWLQLESVKAAEATARSVAAAESAAGSARKSVTAARVALLLSLVAMTITCLALFVSRC